MDGELTEREAAYLDPGGPSCEEVEEWLSKTTAALHTPFLYTPKEKEFITSVAQRYRRLRDVGMLQPLARGQTRWLRELYEKIARNVAREMERAPMQEPRR